MSTINLISERHDFMPLWERATEGVRMLATKSPADLLYFDSIDLQTQKFFDLIRHLLTANGTSDFATLVLKPDPFNYFNFHFGKFPGFTHRAENTADEFFDILLEDPGDSPADALGFNSEHYVGLPLPGDWIAFGDRSWGTGVFHGPPDIMEFAREFYPFFIEPPSGFRVEP